MALLSLHNAYKSFGARKVLENASLSLDDGERVAIIGKNGAGKSTLLKILCEQMPLDSGTLAKRPNLVARILPQDPHFRVDLSVREVCEASLQELVAIHKRVDEINALLQADSREFAQNTELLNELGTLTTQLDSIDGWDLEKRITELIENFHLKELQDRAIGTLSGGELKRLALATILMQPADLYILDEPTNHLDVEVVEFLESKLNALKACVLFISHDRYFIDNCARRIIEVDSSKLTNFRGGYGAYLSQKAAMLESLAKEHSRTLKLLKAEEEWLHKGVQARRKRNVLRKERVELLRAKAKQNPSLMRQIRLELERESKHHNRTHSHNAQKMIIECENLCVSMGGKPLIKNCSLRILQGDKIAIVGRNGAGKSSLLKVFLGEIAPQSGVIKRGELKIGYFAQTRKELDDSKSLIETFCPNGGDHIEVRGKSMHIYGYLKSFLFPKDLLTQKIGALSGGEKTRVSLALLFTKQYDCLLLDEPTNDLDIATINILEEYLLSFSGALLLVSHDRYFIDKLAQKLLILHNPLQLDSSARSSRGESSVEESLQSFSQYLEVSKEIAYYKQLESSLTNRDSALGEQCGSVAKIVKGTTAKVANLPQFLQSSHSPTATPRILGDTGQTELESKKLDSSSPSLRDTALAVAWQSISQTQSEATTQISPRLLYACENISAFYVAAYFPSDRVYFDANMFYTTPIEVALLAGKIDTCEYESLESRLKAFPRLFIDDDYGRWLLQLYKELFIHKIAKLWEKKDCIVIEGRYSSSGVYNDLFSNARSVLRINHLPHHNAYEHLDELKSYVQEVLSGFDPAHTCAILALGHSAKVLGFWLDGLGFRAFDIGSLSLNYDCFLYGADFYTYAGQGNPLELESYVLAPYIAGKRR